MTVVLVTDVVTVYVVTDAVTVAVTDDLVTVSDMLLCLLSCISYV